MLNWLRRTRWGETFRGANRRLLIALAKVPLSTSKLFHVVDLVGVTVYRSLISYKRRLAVIMLAVDWLIDRYNNTVRHIDILI